MATFGDGVYQYGGMPVTGGVPPFLSLNSKTFFVDPLNGADGNSGRAPDNAFASLYRAHYMMTSGNNDVCYFIGNGSSTGNVVLSTANAVAAQGPSETAATTGTLTWSKDACHLIGVTSPTQQFQRAKITATSTRAAFNALPMITFSGNGNYVSNVFCSKETSDGYNGEISFNLTGQRNCFNNVHFGFPTGAASIAGATTRALSLTGASENTFLGCTLGNSGAARSTTNATVEFQTACARNVFRKCLFDSWSSSAGSFHLLGTGDACLDRYVWFDDCLFVDNSFAGGTAMTYVSSFSTGNPGGAFLFHHCNVASASTASWADTNGKLQSRVDNVGGAATAGIMLRPTA